MFSLPFDCSGVPAGVDAFTSVELHSRWCDAEGEPVVVVRVEYDAAPGFRLHGCVGGFDAFDADRIRDYWERSGDDWGEGSRLFERAQVSVSVGRDAMRNTCRELAGEVRGMLHGACVVDTACFYRAEVRG